MFFCWARRFLRAEPFEGFQNLLGDFSVIEDIVKTTLGGIPAEKLVFFGTLQGYRFKYQCYYGVAEKYAYIITYTALEETYEKYLPIFKSMVRSFKINEINE